MRRSWRNLPAVTLSGAVRQDLDRVMPGTISGLERHQWAKHGTCSSFSQFDYFRIAIDRTEDLANTQFAGFVTSNIGAEILRRDLLESFEREFGGRSARALRLICARADNRMLLSEIRLLLRAQDIDRKLARETLAIPVRAASGNCPARFWIDSAD